MGRRALRRPTTRKAPLAAEALLHQLFGELGDALLGTFRMESDPASG